MIRGNWTVVTPRGCDISWGHFGRVWRRPDGAD
ncbi:hypothetical protein CMUS01_04227 [Colletotrichum musicola]|uniref:Uncharacterized protein n=1 Tax=Colletotrichum musicola TaxID=2175873 RepID=A0A8H6KXI5_9PEZI|nr:hypothetical protein CMUS01_04227 [Colletotrichum musicola]